MSKLKVFSMFDGVGGFIVGLDVANKKLNKKFFVEKIQKVWYNKHKKIDF